MGFRIARKNYRYGMRAFCDNCGKEVVDGECNVLSARDIEEGRSVEVMVACKVGCTDKIDPRRLMANQELGQCILHLTTNARIDVAKERERVEEMYAAFGSMF
jgi:hypothetical protein